MIAAIDPGIKNLGIWVGTCEKICDRLVPQTQHIELVDLRGKKAAYEAVADYLSSALWRGAVSEAVVETQAVRNVPARIIANTVFGFFRGMQVPAQFSGAKLKNEIIGRLAREYGVELLEKPEKGVAKRSVLMHKVNKENSRRVVCNVLNVIGDVRTIDCLCTHKKIDDLCDAFLLGVAMAVQKKSL